MSFGNVSVHYPSDAMDLAAQSIRLSATVALQGVIVAAPVYAATGSRWKAMGIATASVSFKSTLCGQCDSMHCSKLGTDGVMAEH